MKKLKYANLNSGNLLVEEEIRNQEEHEKQKIGHRRIDRQGEVVIGFVNNLH